MYTYIQALRIDNVSTISPFSTNSYKHIPSMPTNQPVHTHDLSDPKQPSRLPYALFP